VGWDAFWDALILQAAESCGAGILYSEDLTTGRRYGFIRVVNRLRTDIYPNSVLSRARVADLAAVGMELPAPGGTSTGAGRRQHPAVGAGAGDPAGSGNKLICNPPVECLAPYQIKVHLWHITI